MKYLPQAIALLKSDMKAFKTTWADRRRAYKTVIQAYKHIDKLIEITQADCMFCERCDFTECERYKVFRDMRLQRNEGEGCPYAK